MFEITDSYKATVALLNGVVEDKAKRDSFLPILQRVADKLHIKDQSPFSSGELAQMQDILQLSEEDINKVLALCTYTFQQAGYQGAAPQAVAEHMTAADANNTQVTCFQHVWSVAGAGAVKALRDQKFGAVPRLEGVRWQVQLSDLNSSAKISTDQPSPASLSTVLQLDVSASDVNPKGGETISIHFDKEQMYEFFEKLENVQEQLDNLST